MSDESRDKVRSMMQALRVQVEPLMASHPTLVASFGALEKELDLGEPRRLRKCPACGSSGMAEATICGTCWTKLTPVAP